MSVKYDIVTIQDKLQAYREKKKRSIGITPWERELQSLQLKAAKTGIKKRIEKVKELLSCIGGNGMLEIMTGEA